MVSHIDTPKIKIETKSNNKKNKIGLFHDYDDY